MPITYTIAIDSAEDDTFATDLSADVLQAQWRLGLENPTHVMATPSQAIITLRNRSGTYSPERNSLIIGQLLRITSDDGMTNRTHFIGAIERITPQTGDQGQQQATLIATGIGSIFPQNTIRLAPQLDQRADQIIETILDQVRYRRKMPANYVVIDWTGRNLIDNGSFIFEPDALPRNLQAGKSTFPYAGDTLGDGIPADTALREVTQSEGGYFYTTRTDEIRFINRHQTLINNTLAATFTDDMAELIYDYGTDIVNEVEVRILPRSVGTGAILLWEFTEPQRIKRRASIELVAEFRDENDNPLGTLSINDIVPQIHYRATLWPNPATKDLTENIQIIKRNESSSSVTLEVRNRGAQRAFLQFLEIYGIPLIVGNPLIVTERDSLSITRYGIRGAAFNAPMITDTEDAQAFAQNILVQRANPRGLAQALTTNTRTHPEATLALTLFDRIRITESQTGNDRDYVILAEDHTVSLGGTRHIVTWLLAPVDDDRFFVVDRHNIDGIQILLPR